MTKHSAEKDAHDLDTTARPSVCSCGAKFAGGLSWVRRRHAAHVEEVTRAIPPGGGDTPDA